MYIHFNLKIYELPLKPSANSTKGPSNLDVLIIADSFTFETDLKCISNNILRDGIQKAGPTYFEATITY